jgi:hypothetical protein
MALTPANHTILVEPSLLSNEEDETAHGLHVVRHSQPQRKVWRGVVQKIGAHISEEVSPGDVAHYTDFVEVGEMHIVPEQHLLAWENDE